MRGYAVGLLIGLPAWAICWNNVYGTREDRRWLSPEELREEERMADEEFYEQATLYFERPEFREWRHENEEYELWKSERAHKKSE